jgi:flagellar biosynthetic protein FliR
MEYTFDSIHLYILVFVRMVGMLVFNPLLSRRNLPAQMRVVMALGLTLLIGPGLDGLAVADYDTLDMLFGMLKGLFVGLVCGFVFQLFYYMLFFAGDFLDVEFGLSMARVFDPGSNIQMSISSNLLSIFFALYLFATNCHLLLIRIFATSYDIVPVGADTLLGSEVSGFMINLFIGAFSMAVKLTLPFVAAEFVTEIAMGVLMKLIPQINVFVINIQFKMFLGIFLLLAFASPISSFMDNYLRILFENMENALYTMAQGAA